MLTFKSYNTKREGPIKRFFKAVWNEVFPLVLACVLLILLFLSNVVIVDMVFHVVEFFAGFHPFDLIRGYYV